MSGVEDTANAEEPESIGVENVRALRPGDEPPFGRRERKKHAQRRTIIEVALRLFDAQGYAETTVAEIAAAADIAMSTFFAYFPTKEQVVFYGYSEWTVELATRVEDRPHGRTTVDALAAFVRATLGPWHEDNELERLRTRVIAANNALSASLRLSWDEAFDAILRSGYARDVQMSPADALPRMLAAATAGAFGAFNALAMAGYDDGSLTIDEILRMFDDLVTTLEAGLAPFACETSPA